MEMMRYDVEDQGKEVIQKIPLDLLIPSPYNSRRYRTVERIRGIAQSLSLRGQKEALRVYPGEGDYEGKYVIVSGVTRFLAATDLRWPTLDAIVDPDLNTDDPLALVALSRLYNDTAEETDMDHAALVADLEGQGYSQREIMLAMGFDTPSRLYRLNSFWELPKAIFEIAAQHPDKVTAEFASILKRAVSQLGEEKAVLLAEELISENLSTRKLDGRIRAECRKLANTPARSTKEWATVIRFGGAKVGSLCLTRPLDSDEMEVHLKIRLPEDNAKNAFLMIQGMEEKW